MRSIAVRGLRWRIWMRKVCSMLVPLVLLHLMLARPAATAQATAFGTVRVVIEQIIQGSDCLDPADPFPGCASDGDYYGYTIIDGVRDRLPDNGNTEDDVFSPNWENTLFVNFGDRTAIPIDIELWDSDSSVDPFNEDDRVDISPAGNQRTLSLVLNARPCFVSGPASGACNTTLVAKGDENQYAEIHVRVELLRQLPRISHIPDQQTSEDTPTAPIPFTVGDAETPADRLAVSATSSNQALVPNTNFSFGGGGNNRTLVIRPSANLSGSTTIIVRVDDGLDIAETPFVLTVIANDDPPSIKTPSLALTVNEDASVIIPFTIADPDTPIEQLTVSASSSSQAIVPSANISFGGSAANRTALITLVPDVNGFVIITLHASDGQLSSSIDVTLTIIPQPDPPSVTDIPNQILVPNFASAPIAFTVGDPDVAPETLKVEVSSSDQTLIANSGIQQLGTGAHRTLILTPQFVPPDKNLDTEITVTVSDGISSVSDTFIVTVETPKSIHADWMVLLYMAGDDIEPTGKGQVSLNEALNELKSRLSGMRENPALRLVVLFDGSKPGDSGLFVREPGQRGLTPVEHPQPWPVEFGPELDTGSVATLRNFIAWAQATYPNSTHTMLSIIDHGGGWAPDEGDDGQPRGANMAIAGGLTGMSFDASTVTPKGLGTSLSTKETSAVFDGLGKFDVLFFDACLMGGIESAYQVYPYANYFIAGENILWSRLPYERYLDKDFLKSDTSPLELATGIVDRYNADATDGTAETDEPYTIAAIDMGQLPDLAARVNTLAERLASELAADPSVASRIKAAYVEAQKFDYDSSFEIDPTDAYVDIADLMRQLLKPEYHISGLVDQAARLVLERVVGGPTTGKIILANKSVSGTSRWSEQRWRFDGANGLSIYLPLGEHDCRPTGKPVNDHNLRAVLPCVAKGEAKEGDLQIEPQLRYYTNPEQLNFTRDVPAWAELLNNLDRGVQPRQPDRSPVQTPFPAETSFLHMYLPIMFDISQ